jgi:hypothetical protein
MPQVHLMHHCVIKSTHSANFFFHPIDFLIEFGTSSMAALLFHFFVWKDPFVLLLTYLLVLGWYSNDHNEWVGSFHTEHHSFTDSVYTAYVKIKGNPKEEKVLQKINPAK